MTKLTTAALFFLAAGIFTSVTVLSGYQVLFVVPLVYYTYIATKEKPFLGWGLSNFHSQLKRIKTEYDLDAKDYNDAHSHNLLLEIASGIGLIGLFLFLGWVTAWAIELFKTGGLTRALIFPFGVAFVVSSQFEVTFDTNNASMIFFFYALSSAFRGSHVQQG